MSRPLLPIGIQTFRSVRERGYYYVDKTAYALRMVEQGTHFFTSSRARGALARVRSLER